MAGFQEMLAPPVNPIQASLTSYEPTWRDKAKQAALALGLPPQTVEGMFGQGLIGSDMGLVDMVPGAGMPFALDDIRRSGNVTNLAFNSAAALPIPGAKNVANFGRDLTKTGWTFKDVAHPHKIMEKGDWARVNRARDNQDWMEVDVPIRSLNATQENVNPDFANRISKDNTEAPFVIKKNGQFYVQDGHHRLVAEAASGKQVARVRLVDLDGTTETNFPLLEQMNAHRSGR
jgi:hypothetical protein